MPLLRHLKVPNQCHLAQPSETDIVKETNLQTLSEARNLKITPTVIRMLANIKKLHLYYNNLDSWDRRELSLKNLVDLQKLEELTLTDDAQLDWERIWFSELNLPISLKKLELIRIDVPWEYINIVGLLPKLEVFKMHEGPTTNLKWNPIEGGFLKLKYLGLERVYLKHWGAESIHFPSLEILVLKQFVNRWSPLQEIPSEIGEINGLKLIELHDCRPSVVASAKQIQADQQEMGDEQIQVTVHEWKPFDEEEDEEEKKENDNVNTEE